MSVEAWKRNYFIFIIDWRESRRLGVGVRCWMKLKYWSWFMMRDSSDFLMKEKGCERLLKCELITSNFPAATLTCVRELKGDASCWAWSFLITNPPHPLSTFIALSHHQHMETLSNDINELHSRYQHEKRFSVFSNNFSLTHLHSPSTVRSGIVGILFFNRREASKVSINFNFQFVSPLAIVKFVVENSHEVNADRKRFQLWENQFKRSPRFCLSLERKPSIYYVK